MARITPSPLVDRIRGRIGSVVFSNWKSTQYVRNMSISINNPSSPAQAKIRNLLGGMKARWIGLTGIHRSMWEEYAQGLKNQLDQNMVGTTNLIPAAGKIMSGFNAFSGVNIRLLQLGEDQVDTPPVDSISGPQELDIIKDNPLTKYTITVKIAPDQAVEDSIVRLFVKTNWAGGHTYLAKHHKVEAGDITPGEETEIEFEIEDVKVGHLGVFADVPVVEYEDKVILFQADIISPEGKKSSPSPVIASGNAIVPE